MKSVLTTLAAFGVGGASAAGIRAAIKAYRARKKVGDIVADVAEAVVDTLDHKK